MRIRKAPYKVLFYFKTLEKQERILIFIIGEKLKQHFKEGEMAIVGFAKLEALFRKAASIDLDKNKAKAITDIVEKKLYDLLLIGERNAKYNGREVIWECDIPLTKGFLESIHKFKELEEELVLEDILNFLATQPPLKYPLEAELEQKLPEIVGTLLYIIARILKEVDENCRQPSMEDIERAGKILDLTM